ncbi:MAG: hypothetical protein JWM16_4057 [Verrucomicrobiales bacterium]|nr:hypothetical protein [Verrucomicrobiales bacterium]
MHYARYLRLATFLVVLSASSLFAQPKTAFSPTKLALIDKAINEAIASNRCPGAVFWLERHGDTFHKAFGRRALLPKREEMTEDTIFDAASLTKVLATTPAIMLLVERGQLKLDDTVRSIIPEFQGEGTAEITIRHLMTHTSGLRSGIPGTPAWSGYENGIRLACQEIAQDPPGTVFRYSDINFILLGEVVQRVSHRKLNEFVAAEFYRPLKMMDTGYLPAAKLLPRIAPTEGTTNGMLRGIVHDPTSRRMGGVAGHAGIFTTGADLARYARMLLGQGELEGVRVLKAETVKLMTSVQSPDSITSRRGLGWDIDSGYSRLRGKLFPVGSFGHTGFTGTALWIDPFSDTFYIFLSNRVHPDGKGNILSLQATIGTLAAETLDDYDFANVPGSLPVQVTASKVPRKFRNGEVLNGIDVLEKQNFAPVKKLRLGLITNHTGIDRQRRSTIDILKAAPEVELKALFSPEHGIRGEQDEKISDSVDQKTGLPVYSLYGVRRSPALEQLKDLDALVFDIQDIGCRFYTYIATLGNCLEAAAKANIKFIVLDRVNPINGLTVEGPVYNGKSQFTAYHLIPLRHGMTVGELARMYNAERQLKADLMVIPVQGWWRSMWFDETGLPWINPSPNMRSLNAAALYPGIGIHETALSVGRGTGTPFEVFGAPFIDDVKFAAELNRSGLDGVEFIPVRFTPAASVFKDKPCGGVSVVLSERDAGNMVDIGIVVAQVLHRLYPKEFAFEKVQTLLQSRSTLDAIAAGQTLAAIKKSWTGELEDFNKRRAKFLIYK